MKLQPTKQNCKLPDIIGFDVETANNNFYLGSFVNDRITRVFRDRVTMSRAFADYPGAVFVATNLGYDFFSIFVTEAEQSQFTWQFRGSDMIYARGYLYKRQIRARSSEGTRHSNASITLLDTLNYARLSVDKIGALIGVPKLKKPSCLGRLPCSGIELEELTRYNIRDSYISYRFIDMLYRRLIAMGATPKYTIAASAMSLFRNKYLTGTYHVHDVKVLLDLFKGYYGGRTEAFTRGRVTNFSVYDFNSLYPAMMCRPMPDPNTIHYTEHSRLSRVTEYEGMSEVTVHCPMMEYPLLPYRKDYKLLFPVGTFRGWYTHVELREAMRLGYTIMTVHRTFWYSRSIQLFSRYVTTLYAMRQESRDTDFQLVLKLLLNSLYGKFGQRFTDRDNWIPASLFDVTEHDRFERFGNYFRVTRDMTRPSSFCFPEFPAYISAYGRLELHKAMLLSRPYYVDTDSLFTRVRMPESCELGGLKRELDVDTGYIIRPKFYALSGRDTIVKIKGVGTRISMGTFTDCVTSNRFTFTYSKFMKFKESIRRGIVPNEIREITKTMTVDDDKREWLSPLSFSGSQLSRPLEIKAETSHKRHNAYPEEYECEHDMTPCQYPG